MSQFNRRSFLGTTAAACLAGQVRAEESPTSDPSANDNLSSPPSRVVVGVMGLKRGLALVERFARQPNVEVKYVCDVDRQRVVQAQQQHLAATNKEAGGITDFRDMLEDPELDALVCAAPNHWHAPATILACRAGKHVYVEKPCSHNPWEGEQMVAAARKYGRVVQVGTQRRSSPGTIDAIQRLRDDAIGRVYHAACWYHSARGSIGAGIRADVPDELDYDLWQGPAPRQPYKDNLIHYNWHWHWHWGNGELGNNGVHTLDLARWGLDVDFPSTVTSSGGRFHFQDDQETPDTHTVTYQFADRRSITWQGLSCNRFGDGFVTFYGETGALDLRPNGTFTIVDTRGKEIERGEESNQGDDEHIANFVEAVRRSAPTDLTAEVEQGHRSTLLCHLGNIAHRTGHVLTCDIADGNILGDRVAANLWKREYEPAWEPVF